MTTSRSALLMLPWIMLACLLSPPLGGQSSGPGASRTLSVVGSHGQSGYTLRLSADRTQGRVEVREPSGSAVQTLSCSLLRDEAAPTAAELEAAGSQFVSHFESEDLNFDGYADLKGPREFGAKWARYCVWLYDPQTHRFVKDSLAEQMELLYNLRREAQRARILANSIGPTNPLIDEYRIERVGEDRPYWPRLIPVVSCFIGNSSQPPVTVVTQYERGRAVSRRQPVGSHSGCSEAIEVSGAK